VLRIEKVGGEGYLICFAIAYGPCNDIIL